MSTRSAWSGCTRRRSPTGWWPSSGCPSRAGAARGARERTPGTTPMIEEIRIGSLGVIDSSTLELGPGLTVITGETGAGKTMVVTALGLLLGGRADSGAVRAGARQARVEGVVAASRRPAPGPRRRRRRRRRRGRGRRGSCWPATCRREGRSRAFVGGAAVPVATLAQVAEPLVAVHGQSDQHRLLQPRAQRDALDRFGGAAVAGPRWRAIASSTHGCRPLERELDEVVATARERAREADLLRFGLGEIEAVAPEPGEDARAGRRGVAARASPTPCAAAAEQAREALSSEQDGPGRARGGRRGPRAARRRPRARRRGRASSPTGWPR